MTQTGLALPSCGQLPGAGERERDRKTHREKVIVERGERERLSSEPLLLLQIFTCLMSPGR